MTEMSTVNGLVNRLPEIEQDQLIYELGGEMWFERGRHGRKFRFSLISD
jgi:hypothetical protein